MLEVKIAFFVIGAFFGMQNARIVAEKTVVTLHPEQQLIEFEQQNLYAVLMRKEDSLLLNEEWKILNTPENRSWVKEVSDKDTAVLEFRKEDKSITAYIAFTYSEEKVLQPFGLYKNKEGKWCIKNIPDWNIESKEGTLKGGYWVFDAQQKIRFSVRPYFETIEKQGYTKQDIYSYIVRSQ
ncbi:hypothetical protein HN014_00640 [Aquimarina sp. TRL1]|uniref:hypothetical protein n=1 Tax=Aquimarina sp. (strain TRL1) TaxID=2736252 RepID=UPI00158AB91B|nr:hypothetical protein [Aquimarina sp. TRL1]QKX03484.1 hypothetical protein HN014_00640 [Aquimarina sp. TRL1]